MIVEDNIVLLIMSFIMVEFSFFWEKNSGCLKVMESDNEFYVKRIVYVGEVDDLLYLSFELIVVYRNESFYIINLE